MSFDIARKAVDYFIENKQEFPETSVQWEFIGGEPLLEIQLIEDIIKYILKQTFKSSHPWFESSTFFVTTNGLLYSSEKFQRLVERYREILDVSVSIDGPPHVHDSNRVFPNGQGTYDSIRASIELWIRQFPDSTTKVTIGKSTLGNICDSVLHLFHLGVRKVIANVVYEEDWSPSDACLFEMELDKLADHILRQEMWPHFTCSLFSKSIGQPIPPEDDQNWCGTGRMIVVGPDGTFYPCIRFMPFSLKSVHARPIGNVEIGINKNLLRPFLALTRSAQSPEKCMTCDYASGCGWCQGNNYELSESGTIFFRHTGVCEMHKARVRASRRFFSHLDCVK